MTIRARAIEPTQSPPAVSGGVRRADVLCALALTLALTGCQSNSAYEARTNPAVPASPSLDPSPKLPLDTRSSVEQWAAVGTRKNESGETTKSPVKQVGAKQPRNLEEDLPRRGKPVSASNVASNSAPELPATNVAELNLPQVLHVAGGQSWTVLLAYERIREARAKYDEARVMWLPSINAGVGYTKHDGQIQDTRGDVIDVSRNSLFVGGGGVIRDAPTAAGSGGPARMFIDLSLADAIFQPRSARNLMDATRAGHHATFNDTLLAAALAYYDVAAAQQQRKLAKLNLGLTEELLKLTKAFQVGGKGNRADVSRVDVEVERRKQDVVEAQLAEQIASAELTRLLRINTASAAEGATVTATDGDFLPVDFISPDLPLNELVSQAVSCRPEMTQNYYAMESAREKMNAEKWRPFIPSLHLGVSAGGFGGGQGDRLDALDGRADVDVLAIWQVRNLGLGVAAARRRERSRYTQSQYAYYRQRDRIVAEVSKAYSQVKASQSRLSIASSREKKANSTHADSMKRIKGFQGIPLEALQALQQLVSARRELLNATIAYNQAQLMLLRAVGRAIASD